MERLMQPLLDPVEVATGPVGIAVAVGFLAVLIISRGEVLWMLLRYLLGLRAVRSPDGWDPTWWRSTGEIPTSVLARPEANVPRSAWARQAGYKKMVVRWSVAATVALTIWRPIIMVVVLSLVTVVLATIHIPRLYRARVYRHVVTGWVEVVGHHLQQDPGRWQEWVTLPPVQWIRPEAPEWLTSLAAPATVETTDDDAEEEPTEDGDGDPDVDEDEVETTATRSARPVPRWVSTVLSHRVVWAVVQWVARLPRPTIPMASPEARVELRYSPNLQLPSHVENEIRRALLRALPGGTWRVRFKHDQAANIQRVVADHPPLPPTRVDYTEEQVETYGMLRVPAGKMPTERGAKWVHWDLKYTPHILIQARTRWGKTVHLTTLAAHVLRHGCRVMFLDPKLWSFIPTFGGVQGVAIATEENAMAEFMRSFMAEMDWRYQVAMMCPEVMENPTKYFTPWFLIQDERAALSKKFSKWWKDQGGKGESPVFDWEQEIVQKGAAVHMHVITGVHQANSKVFDTDTRDQYAGRAILGPPSAEGWRMAYPGSKMQNLRVRRKGLGWFFAGDGDPKEIQYAIISEALAHDLAQRGVPVRERDEKARIGRLERATGMPLSALSRPVPNLPGAGGTWLDVLASGEDTRTLELAEPPELEASLDAGDLVTESGQQAVLALPPGDAGQVDSPDATPVENEPSTVTCEAVEQDDESPDEWLYGRSAAAEFLGEKVDTFARACRRYRERMGVDVIPGEVKLDNGKVKFNKADLLAWNSQRYRRGGKGRPKQAA